MENLTIRERRPRLAEALCALGATDPAAAAASTLADLGRRYAQPHRAYHTMQHIDACLSWLDWYRAQAHAAAEVELALWFHDAVYDPARADNEEQSASLASARLISCGVSTGPVERIHALILATKGHIAGQGDAALLSSIDLAILGANPRSYAQYEAGVRQEYCHVPEAAYVAGRHAFLAGLLGREMIFTHPLLRAELEAAARRNLRASVERLTADRDAMP